MNEIYWWCDIFGEAWRPTLEYPEGLKPICERDKHDARSGCGWVRIIGGDVTPKHDDFGSSSTIRPRGEAAQSPPPPSDICVIHLAPRAIEEDRRVCWEYDGIDDCRFTSTPRLCVGCLQETHGCFYSWCECSCDPITLEASR